MGGNVRATALFRAASTFTFLFSPHIFTSLRAASPFVVSQLFIPCRLNSVSNSSRLLFPAEQLLFPTTPAFTFLPTNFCCQLLRFLFPCRVTSVSNYSDFYSLPSNSFKSTPVLLFYHELLLIPRR